MADNMPTDTPDRCRKEYDLKGTPKRCPRAACESGFCALHDASLAKDVNRVKAAIQETMQSGVKIYDFSAAIFYDTDGALKKTYPYKPLFDQASFHTRTDFTNVTFSMGCSFDDATFYEEVDFRDSQLTELSFAGTKFSKGVNFVRAGLRGLPVFRGTEFGELGKPIDASTTDFDSASFQSSPTFVKVKFYGLTSFGKGGFHQQQTRFGFEECDMRGLLLTGCPFFPTHIKLRDCQWPKRYGKFGRLIIHDELAKCDPLDLVRAYRALHELYYNQSEFDNYADEFYVSFMVAKRKAMRGNWAGKFVNLIFSVLSRYGQSITRPLIALLVMWAVVPLILLWLGIRLVENGDFVNLGTRDDYWRAVQLNFSLSTLVRSNELRPSITSIQHTILVIETFLNVLLASFVGLGIRRRFAPKKPL